MPVIIDQLEVAEPAVSAPTHEPAPTGATTTDHPAGPVIAALGVAAGRAARLTAD